MADFGMVMFPNPMVPLSPVIVKDSVVILADWFVARRILDSCVLLMFPVCSR